MALAIKAIPTLDGQVAADFRSDIEKNELAFEKSECVLKEKKERHDMMLAILKKAKI